MSVKAFMTLIYWMYYQVLEQINEFNGSLKNTRNYQNSYVTLAYVS